MAMVTTSSAATTETAGGRAWAGDDFPDWLPPMLVRELRQGIQSGAFFWTFLLLQLLLVLHAAFTVLATSGRFDGDLIRASGGFFWGILVITVGFVIPLRGLNAIATERVGNNLDLVRLTRLSATRIVAGKWAAIVAQVLLVTAAILPYLVLRYFLGGVNVVAELVRLGWLVVAAAVVAARASICPCVSAPVSRNRFHASAARRADSSVASNSASGLPIVQKKSRPVRTTPLSGNSIDWP